jgi:3',5'-cyclic AMP phosphodiesterase CpdA
MGKLVTIAIVSDIHAFSSKKNSIDSVLDYTVSIPANPLTDLIKDAPGLGISADIVICAGDISNRADAKGLSLAWTDLQKLSTVMGNAQLIATNGNHDLDSRFLEEAGEIDPDPKGALLALTPDFPFNDPILTNQYWARNFAVVRHESGVVIVVLNTSAYHGGKQDEMNHGRVSRRTVDAICKALEGFENAKAYVLVCHHHPMPLPRDAGTDDMEYIRNGQDLLDRLLKATGSSWLVVHGHRHVSRLIHGSSSSNAVPFVFGAGSMGARMTGIPNQFHLLTLCDPPISDHASVTGTVESWQWSDTQGWARAQSSSGLPPEFGFGYLGQVRHLCDQIENACGNEFLNWEAVIGCIPGAKHLIPESFGELEELLEKRGINLLRDKSGRVVQVGR